ncbi:MAG: response regulator [Deltaproteobacteria bacterium]|nr:response regulator [Deltaproteobacteria bacterium]
MRLWLRIGALAWSVIIATSMTMTFRAYRRIQVEQALGLLRAATEQDLVLRHWVARSRGVWVEHDFIGEHHEVGEPGSQQEIDTVDGRRLVRVEAAHLLRAVHASDTLSEVGSQGRLTTLNPRQPETAPDPWERKMLLRLQEGGERIHEVIRVEGETVLRLLEPIRIEERCLGCHGKQGFEVGDLRGGWSTSISLSRLERANRSGLMTGLVAQFGIYLLALLGLVAGGRTVIGRLQAAHESASALEESELRFRTVFEAAVEGILVADSATRRFVYCNGAACELLGYSREELLELGVEDIHPKEALPEVGEAFERQTRGDQLLAPNLPCLRKDGSTILVNITATAATIDGRPCTVGFFTNVTEARQMEAKLRQASRMEAVGTLAGGVAHDFNNILQAILGHTELLARNPQLRPAMQQDVGAIGEAGRRAAELTRQLLAYSRRQVLAPAPLALAELCDGMMKMLGRLIPENITLEVTHEGSDSQVLADPGQIEQVVMNLCVNARDALAAGGTISLRTRRVELDERDALRHPDARAGQFVLLEIADDGAGMTPTVRDQIFEPFFTTKGIGAGTGLGLSTVYGIILQHGGWIEVESAPDEGSRFSAFLPHTMEDLREAPEPTPITALGGGTELLLLAEDEEAVLQLTRKLLEQAGYQVLAARDGQEAIALLEERGPQVALAVLDVMMPRRTGREVAEWMRARFPEVPVIFTSGYTPERIRNHLPRGAEQHLISKPYKANTLLTAVREALDRNGETTT